METPVALGIMQATGQTRPTGIPSIVVPTLEWIIAALAIIININSQVPLICKIQKLNIFL